MGTRYSSPPVSPIAGGGPEPPPPSPPRPRSALKRVVDPEVQLCEPDWGERRENRRAGRSGRKKSRGAKPSVTGSCEDVLYADPNELLDSAGSDHSHGSERAPQEVLRITQYPYIIGAEYSEPSSSGSEPDPLALTATHGPGASLGSVLTSSDNGGPESPQESDWARNPRGYHIANRGDPDPQRDPAPSHRRRMVTSSEATWAG